MSIYDFIKAKEGYREDAYWDPHGQTWTQGYGQTGKDVTKGSKSSEEEASNWLTKRVDADRDYVVNWGKKNGYDWNSSQVDSLTSGVYNMGRSYLDKVTEGGSRDNATIASKIPLYHNAGGQSLPGLVTRRNEEAAMFQGGVPQQPVPQPTVATIPRPQPQQSFGDAFSSARASHGGAGGSFQWNGQEYNTNFKEEEMNNQYRNGTNMVPPMHYNDGTTAANWNPFGWGWVDNANEWLNRNDQPAQQFPWTGEPAALATQSPHGGMSPYTELAPPEVVDPFMPGPTGDPVMGGRGAGPTPGQLQDMRGSQGQGIIPPMPQEYVAQAQPGQQVQGGFGYNPDLENYSGGAASSSADLSHYEWMTMPEQQLRDMAASGNAKAQAYVAQRGAAGGSGQTLVDTSAIVPRLPGDANTYGVTPVEASVNHASTGVVNEDSGSAQVNYPNTGPTGGALSINTRSDAEAVLNNPFKYNETQRKQAQLFMREANQPANVHAETAIEEVAVKKTWLETAERQAAEMKAGVKPGDQNYGAVMTAADKKISDAQVELAATEAKKDQLVKVAADLETRRLSELGIVTADQKVGATSENKGPHAGVTPYTDLTAEIKPGTTTSPSQGWNVETQEWEDRPQVGDSWTDSNGVNYTVGENGTATITNGSNSIQANDKQTKQIENQLLDFFGLDDKAVKQALGMYFLSRLTGASHAGSMRWAGAQAIKGANTRKAETKADAKTQEKIDALVAAGYTKESATAAVKTGVEKLLSTGNEKKGLEGGVLTGKTQRINVDGIAGFDTNTTVHAYEIETPSKNKVTVVDYNGKRVPLQEFEKLVQDGGGNIDLKPLSDAEKSAAVDVWANDIKDEYLDSLVKEGGMTQIQANTAASGIKSYFSDVDLSDKKTAAAATELIGIATSEYDKAVRNGENPTGLGPFLLDAEISGEILSGRDSIWNLEGNKGKVDNKLKNSMYDDLLLQAGGNKAEATKALTALWKEFEKQKKDNTNLFKSLKPTKGMENKFLVYVTRALEKTSALQ